ncbi:MAG: TRAP transporter small permease [Proteobacteria bacterium]|nr:TRAP transporter small permease [Desulfobacula sp.]MBU3952892.1 TRAP transporter small permease [Pseudomonadota bacterium]MBU4133054.1 TRAP transporter small permease [Pseudomonadota bacterium]
MDFLMRINKFLNKVLTLTGGVVLIGMILLTCANIVARQVYVPIQGTFEIMGYAGAVVTAFALGYTQFTNGHICVDVLVNAYPKSMKRLISILNHGVCALFFFIVAWHVVQKAMTLKHAGEISETLRVIYYPFILAVALGCFILGLALLTDFLKVLIPRKAGDK